MQGGHLRPGRGPDVLQPNWSPATRLIMGAAGGALAVYGMRHRNLLGAGASAIGAALIARGISNKEISRLIKLERAA